VIRLSLWLILALTALAASIPSNARAQTDPPSNTEGGEGAARKSPSAKAEKEPRSPNEAELAEAGQAPLFYFFTQDNQLVLASNIKYEDIQEYYNLKQGLRQQTAAPKYVVRSVDVGGTVQNQAVDLSIQFEVEILEDATEPIPISLELGGIIRPEIQYRGDGKQFVVFDGKAYVCWMSAKANSKHTFTVKAAAPVEEFEDASNLTLALPYAPSRIQLDVPVPRASFSLSDRRSTVSTRRNGNGTRAAIDSRGGAMEFRWSKANAPSRNTRPLVFANTTLNARVENQFLIRIDATVEARAARGELSAFDIRIPAGLKLSPRRPTGYVVSEPITATDQSGRSIVRIKLDTPAQRAPRIHLAGEITLKPSEDNPPVDVWGFEVVDAHQTGSITLMADDDWVVTATGGRSVRRDRSSPENVSLPSNAARFTVVNQPCSLEIGIRPKATRVVIDPTYQLDVSPTKTDLEIRLLCRFGNGRPLDLELPLNGWTIKELLPRRLVSSDGEFEIENDKLTIPLAEISDAPMGDAEIIIRAERANQGEDALNQPLPTPQVSEFSPGLSLVVRAPLVIAAAANNVQLTPDLGKMPNLRAENIDEDSLPEGLKTRQQPPFAFRGETPSTPLVFHAAHRVQPRSIVAAPSATVVFESRVVKVQETVRLEVSYEPVSRLRFTMPTAVTSSPSFGVALDGKELAVEKHPEGFFVVFPESVIGVFSLDVHYEIALAEVRGETDQEVTIPLAIAESPDLKSSPASIRCVYPDNVRLDLSSASNTWSESSAASRSNDKLEQIYAASEPSQSVTLLVSSAQVVSGSITVERMWVQSWLTSIGRRERAVFRVSTPNQALAIRIPNGASTSTERLMIAADGYRIDELEVAEQEIKFALPDASSKQHLIELWYEFPAGRSPIGSIDFEMPSVSKASRVSEFYWELITPRKEHLLSHPSVLTAEMLWRRTGLAYGRESTLTPQQMADLSGATLGQPLGPRDANRYVFSSLGEVPRIQARTIRRSWLVAIVAGVVMCLGLAWMSLRGSGRSLFFLIVAVVIASIATVYPNPAVLAAQAGFLGLAFLCLGRLLKWAFWRVRTIGVEVHGSRPVPTADAPQTVHEPRPVQPATTQIHATPESGV
jgi:hypothetical protein